MDAKYLAEIKARCDAATKGPWEMSNEPKGSGFFGTIHGKAGVSFSGNRADNEFIAHARTDIPELIAEVERLTDIEKEYHHYRRLSEESDQQIITLKRALELACRYHRFDDFKTVQAEMDFFTKQAREQEGHDG